MSILWTQSHASWITAQQETQTCPGETIYPVCLNEVSIDGISDSCPYILCKDTTLCTATNGDTIDYSPPVSNMKPLPVESNICSPLLLNDFPVLFPPYFGLDQGVPPLDIPLQVIPLQLHGRILRKSTYGSCTDVIPGASIIAWQVDVTEISTLQSLSKEARKGQSGSILSGVSCEGRVQTGFDGSYVFNTTVPPSYGPPRHINILITADGYKPLLTRIYFKSDLRLQQYLSLTDIHRGSESTVGRNVPSDVSVFAQLGMEAYARKGILSDSRILDLEFVPLIDPLITPNSLEGMPGYLVSTFDAVLSPLFENTDETSQSNTEQSKVVENDGNNKWKDDFPSELSGVWMEEGGRGGLVKIELLGHSFFASEYPHPRRWGTVTGTVVRGAVRGADFRSPSYIRSTSDIPHIDLDSISTGLIVSGGSASSSSRAASIIWTGGGYANTWSLVSQNVGYR